MLNHLRNWAINEYLMTWNNLLVEEVAWEDELFLKKKTLTSQVLRVTIVWRGRGMLRIKPFLSLILIYYISSAILVGQPEPFMVTFHYNCTLHLRHTHTYLLLWIGLIIKGGFPLKLDYIHWNFIVFKVLGS